MKPFDDAVIAGLISWLETEDDFVFLESSRVTRDNYRSFLFCSPHQILTCTRKDQAVSFCEQADELRQQGFYLAGWLSYEFGYLLEPRLRNFLNNSSDPARPLAMFGVYDKPFVYNHKISTFEDGRKWPGCASKKVSFSCTKLRPSISQEQYLQAVDEIKEYIYAGDSYQVNFTLHLDFSFQGSVGELYRALRRNQSVSYGAWLRQNGRDILSFSPELFFTASPEGIEVRPMKGTMTRGRTTAEDKQHALTLSTDEKNRSENIMIVDLLRNDLGRLLFESGGGEVVPRSLFDVETYESLLQMTSTIAAIPRERKMLSLSDLMNSLFPCGSVTGAPKIRTMEIIHELEKRDRGVYCGAVGYAGPESMCFNVPIRTIELDGKKGVMGIGSGIVADSDPESEWQECLLKGNFLTNNKAEFQLIETVLWKPDDGFFLLGFHLDRLEDSAGYFHFSYDPAEVRSALEQAVSGGKKAQRVRLLLYRDGRCEVTTTVAGTASLTAETAKVVFSRKHIDPINSHFYHKTTRRSLYNSEYSLAVEQGFLDVLFTNAQGQVTEGAISNLFLRKGKQLFTPPVSCGLLAGTYRRLLLEKGRAVEHFLSKEDVVQAEEVFVANSVRGLVKVEVRSE